MAEPDDEKTFEQLLASFLKEDLAPSGEACPDPGVRAAFYEGKLSEEEARRYEAHLAGCGGCQAEMALLVKLDPAPPASRDAITLAPEAEVQSEEAPRAEAAPAEKKPAREPASLDSRRRPLWKGVASIALAASAILAITVTLRFAGFMEVSGRLASAPRAGKKELDRGAPAAALAPVPQASVEPQAVSPPTASVGTLADERPSQDLAAPGATAAPSLYAFAKQKKGERVDEARLAASARAPGATSPMPAASAPAPSVAADTPTPAESPALGALRAPEPAAKPAAPAADPGAAAPSALATDERADDDIESKRALREEPLARSKAASEAEPPAKTRGSELEGQAAGAAAAGSRGIIIGARTNPVVSWRLLGSTIERSGDSGTTWRRVTSPATTPLLGGSAPSTEVCWIAGKRGTVLRTTDGKRFERVTPPANEDIVQLSASNASSATVRTASGKRFSTSDGGKTWSRL